MDLNNIDRLDIYLPAIRNSANKIVKNIEIYLPHDVVLRVYSIKSYHL